jgi:hypothetical protein
MEKLEIHTLICKRDVSWWLDTFKLFEHYSGLNCEVHVHEDGSFDQADCEALKREIPFVVIRRRQDADTMMKDALRGYPLCTHFRFAEHHTIFRIKLFDPFILSYSNNVMYMDADILFCQRPTEIIDCVNNSVGFYLRDSWSSYCVPFRDEDQDKSVDRLINAGLTYFPTRAHYSLDEIESCLEILYNHGSRGATHPFLEQSCIAYLISHQRAKGINFIELPHPQYCVPTFGKFLPEHGCTALHLNSCAFVGSHKDEHYKYELKKIEPPL